MSFNEFLQWIIDHKDYAPLYSALVATGAFLFSILSFIISNIVATLRINADRKNSKSKYEEQKRQYEERLNEEKRRWEEERKENERRIRISEEPFLVFKKAKVNHIVQTDTIIIQMEFLNKGRGSAYDINPETECIAYTKDSNEIRLDRFAPIEDPICSVREAFTIEWAYNSNKIIEIRMEPEIRYTGASGRKYKQRYCIDILDWVGNTTTIYNERPELCE